MLTKIRGLGEQTLSKIAEVALSSQLEAKHLKVNVKTNPEKLAQGMLEVLAIEGQGLTMTKNRSLESLNITLNSIAVSPFKALMGNIQLTQPSQGTAVFTLTEADLNRALDSETIADIRAIKCEILPEGTLKLKIQAKTQAETVYLHLKPQICPVDQEIKLTALAPVAELTATQKQSLLNNTKKILNLEYFRLQGLSLTVEQLTVEAGKLTLCAKAGITEFPGAGLSK